MLNLDRNLELNLDRYADLKMETISTGLTTTISAFKTDPNAELRKAGKKAFAVLKNNKPSFYVIPPALFERFAELLWEEEIASTIERRRGERHLAVAVDLADL